MAVLYSQERPTRMLQETSKTTALAEMTFGLLKLMKDVPSLKIEISGHTDNTGNANTNMNLGKGRADFAKDYLVKNGILSDNIETSSKGQTNPIADNNTEEGRTKNRRTVITIN